MRGKTLSGAAAVFILAFFFLPWFSVSLNDRVLGQFSGYQLAAGVGDYAIDGLNGRSVLFLVPLSAIVVLLCILIMHYKPAWQKVASVAEFAAGLVGLIVLFWQFRDGGMKAALTFTAELGVMLTMLCFILVFVGAALAFITSQQVADKPASVISTAQPVTDQPISELPKTETGVSTLAPIDPPQPEPESAPPPIKKTTASLYKFGAMADDPSIEAWLVLQEGEDVGKKFRLVPPIRIGRDQGNDIVVDDNSMSGYHAVVREQGGAFHIQDLNSTNGIYLEKQSSHRWQRVPAATLVNDMRIKLGRTIFQVVIEQQ